MTVIINNLKTRWADDKTRKLIISYFQDWVLVILMIIVFFSIDNILPYRREFSLQDKTLMYTHKPDDTVPPYALMLTSIVAPMFFIALISLFYQRSFRDCHSGILGLCLALSMTIMVTDVVKITAGRPRPDFLARCQPHPGAIDPPMGLSNWTVCTTPIDSAVMRDAFKSFPSGHASFSFAGLGYLSFYLAGKMRLFDERGHTYKIFTIIVPPIVALLIAITRMRDYRHHWQDLLVGGVLGSVCAIFAYRQYYPPLIIEDAHLPYWTRFNSTTNTAAERDLRFAEEGRAACSQTSPPPTPMDGVAAAATAENRKT
ncbi:phosphatidic acid phosphatase type 2/haloperoxidase [Dichotomocladium elegans]|nr:phosphatidic acid phosphatase type 2/haloperoxidase [Dichotomocladium elegans]